MHTSLTRTDHRPWPLPDSPWVSRQSWRDLFFLHWPISVAAVRNLVPDSLNIQEFNGTSWLSVVPFRIADLSLRYCPPVPGLSYFPELNLRLYVERDGKPGVWFLSLDAANYLAVKAARWLFYLPYYYSRFSLAWSKKTMEYHCARIGDVEINFHAEMTFDGAPSEPSPGTLEHWLSERYCLYSAAPDGTLYRGEIHHLPWPLQTASAIIRTNDLFKPHKIELNQPPELVQFSKRQDVIFWRFDRLN